MGMGGIWEFMNGKIWEWDLGFRWEWVWDGNGNKVIEMGGICYEKSIPAHLYSQTLESGKTREKLELAAEIIALFSSES